MFENHFHTSDNESKQKIWYIIKKQHWLEIKRSPKKNLRMYIYMLIVELRMLRIEILWRYIGKLKEVLYVCNIQRLSILLLMHKYQLWKIYTIFVFLTVILFSISNKVHCSDSPITWKLFLRLFSIFLQDCQTCRLEAP